MWDLWTKRHWGRFSPSTSISPTNFHSTDCSTLIIIIIIIIIYYTGAGIIGQLVADEPSGLSHPTPRNLKGKKESWVYTAIYPM
jgi:hypothetical protein